MAGAEDKVYVVPPRFTAEEVAEALRKTMSWDEIRHYVVPMDGWEGDFFTVEQLLEMAIFYLDPPEGETLPPGVLGPPRTQEEKVEFRKDWDRRVDEGQRKA